MVCPKCAAVGLEGADCPTHGRDFIEFKCKFCCSISAWFCWGTTHFCDDCHTKQNKGDYLNRKPKSELPKCPGRGRCPLKIEHPPNGEEFAMGCAVCRNLSLNSQGFWIIKWVVPSAKTRQMLYKVITELVYKKASVISLSIDTRYLTF